MNNFIRLRQDVNTPLFSLITNFILFKKRSFVFNRLKHARQNKNRLVFCAMFAFKQLIRRQAESY